MIATAVGWVMGGTGWMPSWAANVGRRLALTEGSTAQLIIGVLFAFGASLVFFGGRSKIGSAFARIGLVAYAFCCVATIASIMASTPAGSGLAPLMFPAIGLACALILYFFIDHAKVTDVAPPRRGTVWVGAGLLAVWVLSVGIALRIPIENTGSSNRPATSEGTVVLDYLQWPGRTLPDTGLSRLLPKLTALTIEGRCVIILYNPECSHCRDLFEKYFAAARTDAKVIAIEIPPAPGTTALMGDTLGPVPCDGCERLTLPAGKLYLVKPPTVLVTEDGRVVCATESDWKSCLGDPPTLPATAPKSEQ